MRYAAIDWGKTTAIAIAELEHLDGSFQKWQVKPVFLGCYFLPAPESVVSLVKGSEVILLEAAPHNSDNSDAMEIYFEIQIALNRMRPKARIDHIMPSQWKPLKHKFNEAVNTWPVANIHQKDVLGMLYYVLHAERKLIQK